MTPYDISGLVHSYLALSKPKEALHAAREAMKAMPQSATALKLVGDVHASNSGGREKVCKTSFFALLKNPKVKHFVNLHVDFKYRQRSFMSQR